MAAATLRILLMAAFLIYPTHGSCTFPGSWAGGWFQSGIIPRVLINASHIETKGECVETDAHDKFVLHDSAYDCYRCMVIHQKHDSVLQYKEGFCSSKTSLTEMCDSISGDAPLYSMFRKDPPPAPEPCPFRQAPFTFTYSRGMGDCMSPPSKAESCTDDSRLLLRYQACPDVPGTESNVEELVCLATWKEGSTRYLVGKISQVNRRNSLVTDEDTYRCFVYKGSHGGGRSTYNIAQSGDATCNALTSTTEGSRTMTLTTSDDHHKRCHFPSWITEHHKWYSLDHTMAYHFTQRNATLKISKEDGSNEEMRLVCHSILMQSADNKKIQIVAHVTQGCESGHACVVFHRRDTGVMEVQRGEALHDGADDACAGFPSDAPYVTLITTTLHPKPCPNLGQYAVISSLADRRKRRQQITMNGEGVEGGQVLSECTASAYESLSIGCSSLSHDTLEFRSACSSTAYTCHGSWSDGGSYFLIAAPTSRASNHPRRYCFIYNTPLHNETRASSAYAQHVEQLSGAYRGRPLLHLSAVPHSCDRTIVPGIGGDMAYNLTMNGTCEQTGKYNSGSLSLSPQSSLFALVTVAIIFARHLTDARLAR